MTSLSSTYLLYNSIIKSGACGDPSSPWGWVGYGSPWGITGRSGDWENALFKLDFCIAGEESSKPSKLRILELKIWRRSSFDAGFLPLFTRWRLLEDFLLPLRLRLRLVSSPIDLCLLLPFFDLFFNFFVPLESAEGGESISLALPTLLLPPALLEVTDNVSFLGSCKV